MLMWQAVVDIVMNHKVLYEATQFLVSWVTCGISRGTLLRSVNGLMICVLKFV